jgi:hypothetical protein
VKKRVPVELNLHQRLIALRKQRDLARQALAGLVEMQISQPVGRHPQTRGALSVSADMLLFAQDERGPDDDLRLQFEAAPRLDPEEKNVIRSVIESIVLRNTFKTAERRFAENGGANP